MKKRVLTTIIATLSTIAAFAQTADSLPVADSLQITPALTNSLPVAVNQYGVKVSSFFLTPTAQNRILVIENVGKGYKFWMDNRVQMDGAYYFGLKNGMIGDNGKPVMKGGVMMRRVRMAVKAEVGKG